MERRADEEAAHAPVGKGHPFKRLSPLLSVTPSSVALCVSRGRKGQRSNDATLDKHVYPEDLFERFHVMKKQFSSLLNVFLKARKLP